MKEKLKNKNKFEPKKLSKLAREAEKKAKIANKSLVPNRVPFDRGTSI